MWYFSAHSFRRVLKVLVKSLPTTLSRVMPLWFSTFSTLPFLCKGKIKPSPQLSGNKPVSNILLNRMCKYDNKLLIPYFKKSSINRSCPLLPTPHPQPHFLTTVPPFEFVAWLFKDRTFMPEGGGGGLVPSTNLYRLPASKSGRSLLYRGGIPRVVKTDKADWWQ